MKNIFKKLTVLFMSGVLTLGCASCGKKPTTPNTDNNNMPEQNEQVDTSFKGVHQLNYSPSDKYIVKDGKTDYTLVCDYRESQIMKIAMDEFKLFFKKATNIDIPVIYELEGLTHSDNNKYIVIGNNALTESAGITFDKDVLKSNGVRIVTKGNSVYLTGLTDRACLYAMYTFLETTFNLKVYNRETYLIETDVEDKVLYNYDVVDVPDIEMRCGDRSVFAEATLDQSHYSSRMKMDAAEQTYFLPIHEDFDKNSPSKGTGHNSRLYLPRSIYLNKEEHPDKYHPKWFANEGKQLCYTARGDQQEFDLMVEECAKKIEFSLKTYTPEAYPYYRVAHIGLEDFGSPCACDECLKNAKHYGADSASKVIFCNALCKKVKEWMAKEENAPYRREDFNIIFFAYQSFEQAPAKWSEEQQTYVPIDDRVKFDDMLGVYYVPSAYVQLSSDVNAPINKTFKQTTEKWSSLANCIYLWTYDANFREYMYMYDTFSYYNDAYGYFAKNKVINIMRQGNSDANCANVTAWANLRAYLFARLTWDTSLKANELIDEYFDAVYKDASPVMKDIFNDNRLFVSKIYLENDFYNLGHQDMKIAYTKYWPVATIKKWIKDYDKAYEAIEKYKDYDKELYDILYRNITLEWVSPVYILFDLYRTVLNDDEYSSLLARFKRDYQLVAPIYVTEHGGATVDSFIDTL